MSRSSVCLFDGPQFFVLHLDILSIFQVSELRAKLAAQKDHNASTKKMLDDTENEKRRLELQILNLKEDLDIS